MALNRRPDLTEDTMTVALIEAASRFGTHEAVVEGSNRWSFSDLADGLRCDFLSSSYVEDAQSATVGFRCCTTCGTISTTRTARC